MRRLDALATAIPMSIALLIFSAALSAAEKPKTIFIITDAEGVAGVCRQEQTDPKDAEMRQLLTGEINSAVAGFFDGGATDVFVWDGHDGHQTLSALTIDSRAHLILGPLPADMLFERHFSAVAFVGQHARADTIGGVMAHSYSSLGIQNLLMNGEPVGEIETRTALAGWFDTPVIFLSGDKAAAEQLKKIVPDAETAVVKEGIDNYSCISLSAEAARQLIRKHAMAAMAKIGRIQPYRIKGPVTIQIEYTSRHALTPDAALKAGAEVIDARTIRFHGKDFLEAWQRASP
ncbi:MAG TPA: M55 family metallopeptidase [Bryobacteraceae bacterium]|jgi:D-amino peptidase|nr:M55 family metallopeptidase [Bryobacteraceae bacterium]